MQISTVFLYTCNEKSKNKIMRTIPFIVISKRIKYLEVNLTKVQDVYCKNYKAVFEEIKEDLNKWKGIPCSWIGRFNIVRMTILPKFIYRLNTISIKILAGFFAKLTS